MEEQNNSSFSYTYSAKQQKEIENIRKKYLPKEENKMEQLRRLDESVTRKGTVVSLIIGIIGALILGFGMSLAMTELGKTLGIGGGSAMAIGIVIGVIGLAVVSFAYPVYKRVIEKERERIAPEIIRLTDELMK